MAKLTPRQLYAREMAAMRSIPDLLDAYLNFTLDIDSLTSRELPKLARGVCEFRGERRSWVNGSYSQQLRDWLRDVQGR